MVSNGMVGRNVEDSILLSEAHWLDRTLPELEWDESEAALVVEDIVGRSPMPD